LSAIGSAQQSAFNFAYQPAIDKANRPTFEPAVYSTDSFPDRPALDTADGTTKLSALGPAQQSAL